MNFDPMRKRRRSLRLRFHDYSLAGAYFVTICTKDRACLFGTIADDEMHLNEAGVIVADSWDALGTHYANVELDAFTVMPNHVHGIIMIHAADAAPNVGAIHESPRRTDRRRMLLPRIIGRFKMTSARHINRLRDARGTPIWQRGYYEHIIRDDEAFDGIRRYIMTNPATWASDTENPDRIG